MTFDKVLRDWFSMLSLGLFVAPAGDSDTHTTVADPLGMPRTFVRVPDDGADALQSASGALRVPIAIAFMLEGAILLAALGGEVFRRNRLVVRRIAEATA